MQAWRPQAVWFTEMAAVGHCCLGDCACIHAGGPATTASAAAAVGHCCCSARGSGIVGSLYVATWCLCTCRTRQACCNAAVMLCICKCVEGHVEHWGTGDNKRHSMKGILHGVLLSGLLRSYSGTVVICAMLQCGCFDCLRSTVVMLVKLTGATAPA